MTDKKRYCPISDDRCQNEADGSKYECRNCPIDSLRSIADSLKVQQEQSTDAMSFSKGFMNKIMPGMTDGFPEVAEPTDQPQNWWPNIIVCKKCRAEIVIVEEPREPEINCDVCGEANLITAVRKD